ncbi:MAG: hypothetical protein ACKO0W_04345 [Planctomycetota bacterium]
MPSVFRHRVKCRSELDLSKSAHLHGGRKSAWGRIRTTHLMQHPTCADCGGLGEEVHHVIPRSVRPDLVFDVADRQSIC